MNFSTVGDTDKNRSQAIMRAICSICVIDMIGEEIDPKTIHPPQYRKTGVFGKAKLALLGAKTALAFHRSGHRPRPVRSPGSGDDR